VAFSHGLGYFFSLRTTAPSSAACLRGSRTKAHFPFEVSQKLALHALRERRVLVQRLLASPSEAWESLPLCKGKLPAVKGDMAACGARELALPGPGRVTGRAGCGAALRSAPTSPTRRTSPAPHVDLTLPPSSSATVRHGSRFRARPGDRACSRGLLRQLFSCSLRRNTEISAVSGLQVALKLGCSRPRGSASRCRGAGGPCQRQEGGSHREGLAVASIEQVFKHSSCF